MELKTFNPWFPDVPFSINSSNKNKPVAVINGVHRKKKQLSKTWFCRVVLIWPYTLGILFAPKSWLWSVRLTQLWPGMVSLFWISRKTQKGMLRIIKIITRENTHFYEIYVHLYANLKLHEESYHWYRVHCWILNSGHSAWHHSHNVCLLNKWKK